MIIQSKINKPSKQQHVLSCLISLQSISIVKGEVPAVVLVNISVSVFTLRLDAGEFYIFPHEGADLTARGVNAQIRKTTSDLAHCCHGSSASLAQCLKREEGEI